MKNILLSILILALVIISSVGIYVYRNFKNDKSLKTSIDQSSISYIPTAQKSPNITTADTLIEENPSVKSGSFIKIDALHYGNGDVELIKQGDNYIIRFKDDVKIAMGPNLHVYMSAKQDYENFNTDQTLDLGTLKSNSGEQVYAMTKEEFEKYGDAVVIWCKAFNVEFTRAELK